MLDYNVRALMLGVTLCAAVTGCHSCSRSASDGQAPNGILEGSIEVTRDWINVTVPQVTSGSTVEDVNDLFGGAPYDVQFDPSQTGSAFWRFYLTDGGTEGIPPYQVYEAQFVGGRLTEGAIIPD